MGCKPPKKVVKIAKDKRIMTSSKGFRFKPRPTTGFFILGQDTSFSCCLHELPENLRKKNIRHIHIQFLEISHLMWNVEKIFQSIYYYDCSAWFLVQVNLALGGITGSWGSGESVTPLDSPHPKINLKTLSSHQNSSSFINSNRFYKPSAQKKQYKPSNKYEYKLY